jgi:hypothetical protein
MPNCNLDDIDYFFDLYALNLERSETKFRKKHLNEIIKYTKLK